MKQLSLTVFCIACLLSHEAVGAEFVNLGFESASLPVLGPGESGGPVPISQALPGWEGFLGSSEVMEVLHNNTTFGSASISVWGPQATVNRLGPGYTVLLVPGAQPIVGGFNFVDASVRQTGLVPAGSYSLFFKAKSQTNAAPPIEDLFDLFIDGQPLALTPLEETSEYTLYGGDVTPYAGSEAELAITAFWIGRHAHALLVDSFEFSPLPVPEPGTWALLGIGGLMLASTIRRRRTIK